MIETNLEAVYQEMEDDRFMQEDGDVNEVGSMEIPSAPLKSPPSFRRPRLS